MPLSVRVTWWPRLNCMARGRLFPPHYDAAEQTVATPPYALPQAEVHARGSMSNLQRLRSRGLFGVPEGQPLEQLSVLPRLPLLHLAFVVLAFGQRLVAVVGGLAALHRELWWLLEEKERPA